MKPYDYLHDLSAAYDGDEYIYNDFAHVSRNGNEILARAIHDLLQRGAVE